MAISKSGIIRRRRRRPTSATRRRSRRATPKRSTRPRRRSSLRRTRSRIRPRRRRRPTPISRPKRRRRRPFLRYRRLARKPRRSRRKRRRPRRKRPFRWWHYPYPPWFVIETRGGINGRSPTQPPPWANRPEMRRYSREAQGALWRHNLLRGVWIDRLMQADDRLVQFVNRFYRAPGFHYVVRDYFNGRFKRDVAQMAMRLARRFRDPGRALRFERSLSFARGGVPVRGLKLVSEGVHYLLNARPRIDGAALRQQFRRSVALYGNPQNVRWVFDGARLGLGKRAVVDVVRRSLRRPGSGMDLGNGRAWLNRIDRLVVIV